MRTATSTWGTSAATWSSPCRSAHSSPTIVPLRVRPQLLLPHAIRTHIGASSSPAASRESSASTGVVPKAYRSNKFLLVVSPTAAAPVVSCRFEGVPGCGNAAGADAGEEVEVLGGSGHQVLRHQASCPSGKEATRTLRRELSQRQPTRRHEHPGEEPGCPTGPQEERRRCRSERPPGFLRGARSRTRVPADRARQV